MLEPAVFDYVERDQTQWERGPRPRLARDEQLMTDRHTSFWQRMNTTRDKRLLDESWATGRAPWRMNNRKPQSRHVSQ